MFGRGKVTQEELQQAREQIEGLEQIITETAEAYPAVDAGRQDLENSRTQMKINMGQVDENNAAAVEQAEHNSEDEAQIIGNMKEVAGEMTKSEQEYEKFVEKLHDLTMESQEMVENNKYFTHPSKYIYEAPKELVKINGAYLDSVEKVEEYSKQIGVIALNMAIEAGRMGESGIQFVSAAEEVRKFAAEFEVVIGEMKELVRQSDEKLQEFGRQSAKIVGLLKDNNVAAVKMYNAHQSAEDEVKASTIHPYSPKVLEWREQMMGVRNNEEEILKLQERTRMQIEDIRSEMEAQDKAMKDVTDKIGSALEKAKEYIDKK